MHAVTWSALFIYTVGMTWAVPRHEGPSRSEKPKKLQVGIGTKPFDVTRHAVDLAQIVQGGVARDAIPALSDPKFVSASEARKFLRGKDEVIGISENGFSKAYPIKILNHHEVVNDLVGGRHVTVTY